MKDIEILKEWKTIAGYVAVVLKTSMGHNCGYVGIPKSHKLYGKNYSQHCDCLIELRDKVKKETIGKRGIISLFCWDGESATPEIIFNVHGGLTYSATSDDYPIKSNLHWFGYDCAHCDDTPENCDLNYCIEECESLAKQLKEV